MKKSKKIYILVFTAVIVTVAATFSGCTLWGDNFSIKNIDVKYRLLTPTAISDYETVNPLTVAATVYNIVMPSTLEVTCNIGYSYTMAGKQRYEDITYKVTAVVLNSEGYLLTSARAVALMSEATLPGFTYEKREISVFFSGSTVRFIASLISYDFSCDLAVLKIDTSSFESPLGHVTFFNHAAPKTGATNALELSYAEPAVVIGNGYGFGLSVTSGMVAAPVRYFDYSSAIFAFIQTDIPMNAGFAGAPLCTVWGSVMGLLSSYKAPDGGDVAYAIPTYTIVDYLNSINTGDTTGRLIVSGVFIQFYRTDVRKYQPGAEYSN